MSTMIRPTPPASASPGQLLGADQAADFLAEYGKQVRAAYAPSSFGTVFPFRRVFTVAHRTK